MGVRNRVQAELKQSGKMRIFPGCLRGTKPGYRAFPNGGGGEIPPKSAPKSNISGSRHPYGPGIAPGDLWTPPEEVLNFQKELWAHREKKFWPRWGPPDLGWSARGKKSGFFGFLPIWRPQESPWKFFWLSELQRRTPEKIFRTIWAILTEFD